MAVDNPESARGPTAALAAFTEADQAGQGPGTVAGQAQHYPLSDSAFLNGAFAHSLEFGDAYIEGGLHPARRWWLPPSRSPSAGTAAGKSY
jgi:2-methylcitrate dehydratase PrpD